MKKELFGEEAAASMKKGSHAPLPNDIDALQAEIESLKKQIYHLLTERDILEKTAEIVKKDQGISLGELVKARVIDALNDLLEKLAIPKSSYFYQKTVQSKPEKHLSLRAKMKEIFAEGQARYGYRHIHATLKACGITVSEKVVRLIMKEDQFLVPLKRKRTYRSYLGEITSAVDNIIARNFHADAPNKKWLTDLAEFHIPAGKIYLSPIINCFTAGRFAKKPREFVRQAGGDSVHYFFALDRTVQLPG